MSPADKNVVALKEEPNFSSRAPKQKVKAHGFGHFSWDRPGPTFEFWNGFQVQLPTGCAVPPEKTGVRLEPLSDFGLLFEYNP